MPNSYDAVLDGRTRLMSVGLTMADLLEECLRFAEGVSECEIDFTSVAVIEPHIAKLSKTIADLREAGKP